MHSAKSVHRRRFASHNNPVNSRLCSTQVYALGWTLWRRLHLALRVSYVRSHFSMPSHICNSQSDAVGRPYIQGLCLGGEAGVAEQIKCILCEFEICLGLCGYKDIKSIWGNRRALTHKSRIPKLWYMQPGLVGTTALSFHLSRVSKCTYVDKAG